MNLTDLKIKVEQQTAEIKKLEAEIERLHIEGLQINKTFMDFVNKQIAETIKEFAKKLKNCFAISGDYLDIINIIDSLVKEMMEVEE